MIRGMIMKSTSTKIALVITTISLLEGLTTSDPLPHRTLSPEAKIADLYYAQCKCKVLRLA